MTATIDISNESQSDWCPENQLCKSWIDNALQCLHEEADCDLSLRFVSADEIASLNKQYRGKPAATNVLSFPSDAPREIADSIGYYPLGDIVICPSVLEVEAQQQGKALEAHWAHMLVHGLLHLYGYDHEETGQAETMENLEIEILKTLGIPNPYLVG